MAEYIEREAAIESFRKNLDGGYVLTNDAQTTRILQSIPAADVREVKRSHWFDGACVNCGFKPALDYEYATVYDDYDEYRWNYCPNCGADMREES